MPCSGYFCVMKCRGVRRFIAGLLLLTATAGGIAAQAQEEVYWPCDDSLQVVRHTAYTLGYSEDCEQAAWVFYLLTRDRVEGSQKRRGSFKADPLVPSGSATPADYLHSGYDRGHLCPAADNKYSATAMRESFYMSNMSPQRPGFNRGIWKRLEEQFRLWTVEYDSLYVVTGGVLTMPVDTIGSNEVVVPAYFYKIALRTVPDTTAVAFLLANAADSRSLPAFMVSIDSVEAVTGLDFFCRLPNQAAFETQVDSLNWEFDK